MKEEAQQSSWQETQDRQQRYCPRCTAMTRLSHEFLDPRTNKAVRIYTCGSCGELIWGN